jgi:hypothetical protein
MLVGDAWGPVVFLSQRMFVRDVGFPQDVVWACPQPMPTCVLRALDTYPPQCRLHVHTFSLPSLYAPEDRVSPENHPLRLETEAERLLAASPCLHSMIGPCIHLTFGSNDGKLKHLCPFALLELLSTLSPQVRHVHEYTIGSEIPLASTSLWHRFCTSKEAGGGTQVLSQQPRPA